MVVGVQHLMKYRERAMGMEDLPKKSQVQVFWCTELQRRLGTSMAEWVNVFEKAVLHMKSEGLNVEQKIMGWHFFDKNNLTLERQERFAGSDDRCL